MNERPTARSPGRFGLTEASRTGCRRDPSDGSVAPSENSRTAGSNMRWKGRLVTGSPARTLTVTVSESPTARLASLAMRLTSGSNATGIAGSPGVDGGIAGARVAGGGAGGGGVGAAFLALVGTGRAPTRTAVTGIPDEPSSDP
jgi:hypothetical protein